MRRDGFRGQMDFIPPSGTVRAMLSKAEDVLQDLVPSVWSKTRGSVYTFSVVRAEFESAYNSEAPRSFMINERMFTECLMAADTLLHESLHQKMADIRSTHLFFANAYDDIESETRGDVMVPWGKNAPRKFSLARALATHHVYVHSSLLYGSAFDRADNQGASLSFGISQQEILRRLKRALDRANFLGAALDTEVARSVFAPDAKRMIKWLESAFHAIVLFQLTDIPNRFQATGLQVV